MKKLYSKLKKFRAVDAVFVGDGIYSVKVVSGDAPENISEIIRKFGLRETFNVLTGHHGREKIYPYSNEQETKEIIRRLRNNWLTQAFTDEGEIK
jgi:hypothetical protein